MAIEYIRIPLERTAVLIGRGGKTRETIERATETRIDIDSKSGEVSIKARGDAIKGHKALNVVRAISRGFSPEHALRLLNEGIYLEVIDLVEYAGKSTNALGHKRGRVIGTAGKTRGKIEDKTNTCISVYGKTVAVIGDEVGVARARRAVEMLLGGATHSTVERELGREERKKFEI